MKKTLFTALAATAFALSANAQNHELTIDMKRNGAHIQKTMYGLFIEDINFAADGGLYAELVKNRELYVAKLDGTVIGFALLKMRVSEGVGKVTRKIMLIDQVCVDEALRNHGIGTQMMEEVRVLARAFGCTDLQLGVYPQNDAAVSFYQKCGFMIRSIDMQRKV